MNRRQLLFLPAALYAQDPVKDQGPVKDQDPVIRVDVDLVGVLFSVRDKSGRFVKDLAKEDIEVFEDGKKQEIRTFNRETDLPLTIGMLVDVSGSQHNLIEVERAAASQFFKQVLRQKDMAFLIGFGPEAELLQDYTNSMKLLERGLADMKPLGGGGGYGGPVPNSRPKGTILFDATYLAADEKLKGEVGRKAIILITDGVDVGSRFKVEEAIAAAHRADALIYSIYYVDYRQYYGSMMGTSDHSLKKMSEETGGRLFRVDRKYSLPQIFNEIQEEMRSQYAISYTSTNTKRDGAFRKLELRTRNKELKVQARKGYFAS